jgi:hypothetical protein
MSGRLTHATPAGKSTLRRTGCAAAGPGQSRASRHVEFEITDVADVTEVLAWAQETANPRRTYMVYVVVEGRGELGLARLAGADPTRPSDST